MEKTITTFIFEDDNLSQGHEIEIVVNDNSRHAFESIKSVGENPIATDLFAEIVKCCWIVEPIMNAINENAQNNRCLESFKEVTWDEVEKRCQEDVRGVCAPPLVLDTDYSEIGVAA